MEAPNNLPCEGGSISSDPMQVLSMVLEGSPDAVLVLRPVREADGGASDRLVDLQVQLATASARLLLGIEGTSLSPGPRGQRLGECCPCLIEPPLLHRYQQALDSTHPAVFEHRMSSPRLEGTFEFSLRGGGGWLTLHLRDVTSERQERMRLLQQLEMEMMVSGLLSHFSSVPPEDIDTEVFLALQTIGDFSGVDRTYITLIHPESRSVIKEYEWQAPGLMPLAEVLEGVSMASSFSQELAGLGEDGVIYFSGLADLPPEAQSARGLCEAAGIRSLLQVPLIWKEAIHGYIGLTCDRRVRGWQEMDIRLLKMLGDVMEATLVRARAELSLRESERYNRMLFEQSPIGLALARQTGEWLDANPALAELLGRTVRDLLRMSIWDLLPDRHVETVREHFSRLSSSGQFGPGEMEFFHADGRQVPVRVRGMLVGPQNEFIWMSIEDIAEQKRAEAERLNLEAQVRQSQKLESLGVLAGGIAHDFNNLLMAISGNADLAMMDLDAPQQRVRESLDEIKKATTRAAQLSNQMLAYTGKGMMRTEPVDLNELAREMANLLKATASKKVSTRLDLAETLPAIEADPAQMSQIVMNLFTNAAESIGENEGTVTVRTACEDVTADYLNQLYLNESLREGPYVALEVSDTGSGMDEETRLRIFDPFFTTKFTGRGLGLAATLGIVRSHGGAIRVYSQPGRGSSFKVLFPVGENQPAPSACEDETVLADWKARGTVLVADDEMAIRNVATSMLKRMGFEVLTAANGREAAEIFRRQDGRVSAVLLDMSMPVMGGVDALREIRGYNRQVPVFLCSGFSEQDIGDPARQLNLSGFLQKPYRMLELKRKLREALNGDS